MTFNNQARIEVAALVVLMTVVQQFIVYFSEGHWGPSTYGPVSAAVVNPWTHLATIIPLGALAPMIKRRALRGRPGYTV